MNTEFMKGVVVPILTVIDGEEKIDEAGMRDQVEYVIQGGVSGILAFGSNGEFYMVEEDEMEPFFTALEGKISGKKVVLFGSYDWGDGQWMRDWAQRAQDDGAQLFSEEGLICNETPDDDVQAACRKLGADLAAW